MLRYNTEPVWCLNNNIYFKYHVSATLKQYWVDHISDVLPGNTNLENVALNHACNK